MQPGSQSAPELPNNSQGEAAMPAPGNLRVPSREFDQSDSRSWPRIIGISLLVLLVALAGAAYGTYATWSNSGQLATGIIIQGEDVGGLSQQEARARLNKRFGRLFLEVQTPERPYKLSLRELG